MTTRGHPRHQHLLTAHDVAAILGITTTAVYARRKRGTIPPSIRFGNTLRWRQTDVDRWLNDHTEHPRP